MANIKTHLDKIKNALFGQEVRGSIHDGIDAINKEVEGTTEKQNKLGEQFKNLVINEGNSNAEVAASRGSHDWLPDRLDNFDSQLEQYRNGKIPSSKLDTSTDSAKIKQLNLSTEVLDLIKNPVKLLGSFSNGLVQYGCDIDGKVQVFEDNPKKFVINKNKIDLRLGNKIIIKTNFKATKLITYSYDSNSSGLGLVDWKTYVEGGDITFKSNAVLVNITIAKSDESDIEPTDIIEIYQGGATPYQVLGDGSVAREKIANNAIDNTKVNEPISQIIPWSDIKLITKSIGEGSKIVEVEGFFSSTYDTSKYNTVTKTQYTIPHMHGLYINYLSKTLTVESLDTVQKNGDKYLLCYNIYRMQSNIPRYQNIFDRAYRGIAYNVITVGKNNCDYKTIQEAVNNANDSANNPVVILVSPGIYGKVKCIGNRYISIIGVDREHCYIKDNTALYNNSPLEIDTHGTIKNLTFHATDTNNQCTTKGNRAYGVHVDFGYDNNSKIVFDNCRIISDVAPAVGMGLWQDHEIIFKNCEIESNSKLDEFTSDEVFKNGAFFMHTSQRENITNQKLKVINCAIKSKNGRAIHIADVGTGDNAECDVTFINTIAYSETLSKDECIKIDDWATNSDVPQEPNNNKLTRKIKLNKESFGNNLQILNGNY